MYWGWRVLGAGTGHSERMTNTSTNFLLDTSSSTIIKEYQIFVQYHTALRDVERKATKCVSERI